MAWNCSANFITSSTLTSAFSECTGSSTMNRPARLVEHRHAGVVFVIRMVGVGQIVVDKPGVKQRLVLAEERFRFAGIDLRLDAKVVGPGGRA